MNFTVFTSSFPAVRKRNPRYTDPPRIPIIINVGQFVIKDFVSAITANIKIAPASCLRTGFVKEKSIYLLTITKIIIDVAETTNDAPATPLNPNLKIARGVRIHVAAVQNIMKYKVTFTFPIAVRKLVRGVEIDENIVLSE